MYYSRVGMLAIILHVIINASALFKKHKTSSPVPLRYRVFLFSVLFFYLADFLWGILLEQRIVLPAYILSVAFFATMGLSVFFWIRFIQVFLNRRNIWSTLFSYVAWALLIIELSSLIANIFLPLMFTFTPEGEYVPGIARSLILYVQIVLFAMVSVYTLIRAFRMEDRDRSHHFAISISGFVMAFFIILQALYPMTPFYSMGLLIATSMIHSFVIMDEQVETSRQIGSISVSAMGPLKNSASSSLTLTTLRP